MNAKGLLQSNEISWTQTKDGDKDIWCKRLNEIRRHTQIAIPKSYYVTLLLEKLFSLLWKSGAMIVPWFMFGSVLSRMPHVTRKKIILKHELLRMLISHLFQSRKMYAPWRNGRRIHLFIVVSNASNSIAVIYLFTQKYQMCWNLSRAKNNKCASTTCQHILANTPFRSFLLTMLFFLCLFGAKKNQEREKERFCESRLQRFS